MALSAHGPDGHHLEPVLRTPREVTDDLLGRLFVKGPRYWLAVVVLGFVFLLGVVGFALRVAGGLNVDNRAAWSYYVAFFSFLLSSALAAPIVAWMTRAAKGQWARTLRRPAELTAAAALLMVLWFIPMLSVLPTIVGRRSIWFEWPVGAPNTYNALAVFGLAFLGLAILYIGALPDIAAARDRAPAGQGGLWTWLARGWRGTPRQWYAVQHGVAVLGGLYFAFFIFVQYLISLDYSLSLIPGFYSSVFPAYNAVTGFAGGVAITLIVAGLLRWVGGYGEYLGLDQSWSLAKIQLPLGLFWFYFFWSYFIVFWYGRMPREQTVAEFLQFGPYFGAFIVSVIGLFLVPFLALIWNKVRVSIVGPFVVSVAVLIGLYFDRVSYFVAGMTVPDPFLHELEVIPPGHYPDWIDVLLTLGGLAGIALLTLLALRVVPAISLWEVKEALLLRVARPYLRGTVRVIGKPR